MRRAIDRDSELIFRSPEIAKGIPDFVCECVFFGFLERWNVQTAICPDSAAHSRARYPGYNLERLEPENQRRDYLSAFSGENGNDCDFVNRFTDGILIRDVSDLLGFREFLERQFRLGIAAKSSDVLRIWRRQHRPVVAEETIKLCLECIRDLIYRRLLVLHQVAQLVFCARIQ